MARPLRIDYPGAWHHVMNRGAGHRLIFRDSRHSHTFLDLVGEVVELYRVEVHAYCLMGNHYHLLMHTPEAGLSRAMRHLDGVYTQRFNRSQETDGPLFRGRFRSALIEADAYLLHCGRYIHLNPVEAGIVERPEEYEWSSYRHYVTGSTGPEWLRKEFTLRLFDAETPRCSYRDFVEGHGDGEVDRFYRQSPLQPILGSKKFRREIEERLRGSVESRELPARRRIRARPTFSSIVQAVAQAFDATESDLLCLAHARARPLGVARGTLVLLARHAGGLDLATIASRMGYSSYAGAASAMRRVESLIASEASIRDKVHQARDLVNQSET